MSKQELVSSEYGRLLEDLKTRLHAAQTEAASSVNLALMRLYWSIGRDILKREQTPDWGIKSLDQLARDLRREFPAMKGFTSRNLAHMRIFATVWPEDPFAQELLRNLPWFHVCLILDKVSNPDARRFYLLEAAMHGWTRATLSLRIESGLHAQQAQDAMVVRAPRPPGFDLVRETLKDPDISSS